VIEKMTKSKLIVFLLSAGAWTLLTGISWQPWFESWAVFRFLLGVGLFLLPGVLTCLLILAESEPRWAFIFLAGFATSVTGVALLGIVARALAWNFAFIRSGLTLWGIVAIGVLVFGGRKFRLRVERLRSWEYVPLVCTAAVVAYLASLAMPPLIHDDAFSYNALLYYFQHAGALTFQFPDSLNRLEIPRFWIAYWPLVEAVISTLGGIDGLLITGIFLSPVLVALSALGIYELAVGLGLGRNGGMVAVLAQGLSLMRLTRLNQPGSIFFYHLTHDKVAAAFVLTPILILCAVEYLQNPAPRRLCVAVIAALAMVFAHPVIFGMTCMIVGIYGILSLFNERSRWAFPRLLAILAAIALVPYSFRFGGGEYQQSLSFSLTDVIEHGELVRFGVRRIDVIEGTSFYGISHYLAVGLPYKIALGATLLSLFLFMKSKAARLVLAAFLLLGLAMFPYTGWLIGFLTSPFQLWRLTWVMPFGLAAALMVWALEQMLLRINWKQRFGLSPIPVFYGVTMASMVAGIAFLAPWAKGNLEKGQLDLMDIYSNYISVGTYLNGMHVAGAPIIIGGPDDTTNSIIPSLTVRFAPLVFRVESGGVQTTLWKSIFGDNIPLEDRYSRLRANHVDFVLAKGQVNWLEGLVESGQLESVYHLQRFTLYRLVP